MSEPIVKWVIRNKETGEYVSFHNGIYDDDINKARLYDTHLIAQCRSDFNIEEVSEVEVTVKLKER